MTTKKEGPNNNKSNQKPMVWNFLPQYLRFLLLKEIEPSKDPFVIDEMSAFYERYRWAFKGHKLPSDSFFENEVVQPDIPVSSDEVEFLVILNWHKLTDSDCRVVEDNNPLVPYIDQSVAGITTKFMLHDAFIQPELVLSDRDKVHTAVVRCDSMVKAALIVITDELYNAFGDEDDHIRYRLATEYFQTGKELRKLLFDAEARFALAKTLAYIATLPLPKEVISTSELTEAIHKINGNKTFNVQSATNLLEKLGFISQERENTYAFTDTFCVSRNLFSAFGCCIGASYWSVDQRMDLFETITNCFSVSDAQRHLSLMVCPKVGRKLLEPVLLMAEAKQDLHIEDRAALFDFMMNTATETNDELLFSSRIADALLSDNLLPDEANYFIESDPDDLPNQLMDYIQSRFRASTKKPEFYYATGLLNIISDYEPAFSISLGIDLASSEKEDLQVLGFSILGTLAKATLEQWNLSGIDLDTIPNHTIIDKLLALAATNSQAQTFYQKILSNLVAAGYIRTGSAICLPNPSLPKQYRDPWLAEGVQDAVGFYPREFYVLDNFSPFAIRYDGEFYPTAEHAYQAQKFTYSHPDIAELIRTAPSPHEAKILAEKSKDLEAPNWDMLKVQIMEDILAAKLQQHPYCKKKLLETGNMPIVEDSPSDSFWGIGPDRKGKNHLGRIWMRLREKLRRN